MSVAPDYVDALVAWRAWLVVGKDEETRLRSIVFPAAWSPGSELVAECRARRRLFWPPWRQDRPHRVPSLGCDCGIYGARDIERASEYLQLGPLQGQASPVVLGRVQLWGSIVEHKLGWRASHAYPADIYVPAGPLADRIALDLSAYGVPIEVLEDSPRPGIVEALARRIGGRPRKQRAE